MREWRARGHGFKAFKTALLSQSNSLGSRSFEVRSGFFRSHERRYAAQPTRVTRTYPMDYAGFVTSASQDANRLTTFDLLLSVPPTPKLPFLFDPRRF